MLHGRAVLHFTVCAKDKITTQRAKACQADPAKVKLGRARQAAPGWRVHVRDMV